VDIYIPDSAKENNALVVINNGSNNNGSGSPVAPTNFSEKELTRIAVATRTVVISVSNVPNQVLSYQGVTTPLAEDDSVAYSWKLLRNTRTRPFISLWQRRYRRRSGWRRKNWHSRK